MNLPLGAREVSAVALFRRQADGTTRVSLRSKDAVDVRSVAGQWKDGGHKNAAGCTLTGAYEPQKAALVQALARAHIAGLLREAREAANRAETIEYAAYDLKAVNPNRKADVDLRTPAELLDIIEAKGGEVAAAIAELRKLTRP